MALNDQIPSHAAAVTPSDSVSQNGCSIFVGGAGNVVMLTEGGDTVTFAAQAGATIVQRFVRILAASTATLMVRQW